MLNIFKSLDTCNKQKLKVQYIIQFKNLLNTNLQVLKYLIN